MHGALIATGQTGKNPFHPPTNPIISWPRAARFTADGRLYLTTNLLSIFAL